MWLCPDSRSFAQNPNFHSVSELAIYHPENRWRRTDQIGCAVERATLARRTPANMNGGRAGRGSEFAYHRAATPPMNISGAEKMVTRTAVRDCLVINALADAPSSDKNSAIAGMRTRASEAASSVFFTTKPPGSFIPLAANASRSHCSTRASKVSSKTNPTLSKTRVPTIAHHTPLLLPAGGILFVP